MHKPDATSGHVGHISRHLGSLLGVIELTVLCAFGCRVGYSNAQIRETLLYKWGVQLLVYVRVLTNHYTRDTIAKQLAVLIISLTSRKPCEKNPNRFPIAVLLTSVLCSH